MAEVVFKELGFPIVLIDPEMIEVRGELVPKVDMKTIQNHAVQLLWDAPGPLTGDQFRFIRKYLKMPMSALAEAMNVDDVDVARWDAAGRALTGMRFHREGKFRLWVYRELGAAGYDESTPVFRLAEPTDAPETYCGQSPETNSETLEPRA